MERLDFLFKHIKSGNILDIGNLNSQGGIHKLLITKMIGSSVYGLDVMNQDDLGTAWQWEGNSYVETNAETDYYNHFDAWTVNDPATTPATGGYTKYDYSEHTESTNPNGASTQDMTISGFGNTQIYSHVHTDFGSWQGINTKVNK